jgi:hypothetical protein
MAINGASFNPPERERWRLIATGQSPIASGNAKYPQWSAATDTDRYAIRNGGMAAPLEWTMPVGHYYYRFMDSARYSRPPDGSGKSALFGEWWIEYEVMRKLVGFARQYGDTLESAASYFLALPSEWGDRARLARVRLGLPLRAWRGRGLPAQSASGRYIPPQHLREVFQLFVPGEPAQRAAAFVSRSGDVIYTRDFDKARWFAER